MPLIIDKIDKIYTINAEKFNLDKRYANGPTNIVDKTTNEAINAKLAINYRPHYCSIHHLHNLHLH